VKNSSAMRRKPNNGRKICRSDKYEICRYFFRQHGSTFLPLFKMILPQGGQRF